MTTGAVTADHRWLALKSVGMKSKRGINERPQGKGQTQQQEQSDTGGHRGERDEGTQEHVLQKCNRLPCETC